MLCRLCKKADESIDHVVSGCSKLAQKECKRRHDNLGKIVHWKLARKCNLEAEDKKRRVAVDKKRRTCKIIDFAVPGDSRIEEKEKEKIEKYQDLRRNLQKIWNVRVKIIPLVVGSLGAIPKEFANRLKEISVTAEIGPIQKTVLLGTARILRKVLGI